MFLAVPTTRSPFTLFRKLFCLLVGLCLAFVANVAVTNSAGLQAEAGLRLELPANGNLRVENLRGGVIAELWSENYVSVSALTDSGQERTSNRSAGPAAPGSYESQKAYMPGSAAGDGSALTRASNAAWLSLPTAVMPWGRTTAQRMPARAA